LASSQLDLACRIKYSVFIKIFYNRRQSLTETAAETYNRSARSYLFAVGKMRTSSLQARGRIRTQLSRVFACVLLAGIVYAATAGTVHSHGSVLYGFESLAAVDIAGQNGVSSELPLGGPSDGNQCLICVLHRQFSNSIV